MYSKFRLIHKGISASGRIIRNKFYRNITGRSLPAKFARTIIIEQDDITARSCL